VSSGVSRSLVLAIAVAIGVLVTGSSGSARSTAGGLTLSPTSQSLLVGGSATVTAFLQGPTGGPAPDQNVNFTVTSGPNAGKGGTRVTDGTGHATFTYSSSAAGLDTVTATAPQFSGATDSATVQWNVSTKTDPKVTMTSPSFVRVGQPVAFTSVVSNGGPDTATGVELRATVPSGATFVSASSTVGTCSGTSLVICAVGTLANGGSATVTISISRPTAGSLSLTAIVQGDHDTDTSNNTASATTPVLEQNAVPPPPPASSGPGAYNAVGTGTISVNGTVEPGDQQFVLKDGDTVDVANGIITFTDSNGISGSWAKTRFTVVRRTSHVIAPALGISHKDDNVASKFQVQSTAGGPTTLTLVGGDFSACTQPRSLAARSQRPVQQLWGSAKGAFTTKGRFAAATVRGTFWFIEDRCDGTLTQVEEGVVSVFDSTLKKTVTVGPGQSYLALAPITVPRGTPRQTAAQVARRGLVWGRKTYKTRKPFEAYLKSQGETWALFVKAYPKLAAALARRR
jgi:uncharacterized repeat protein (TIGR01451 family)